MDQINHKNDMIMLVSQVSSQLQLMVDYLGSHLGGNCTIMMQDPEVHGLPRSFHHGLVLLDADSMSLEMMQQWHPDNGEVREITLVAFNVRDESQAFVLVTGLKLRGILYRHDPLELFCQGIQELQDGKVWMSRSLMQQVVETYQRQQQHTYRPACGLTPRELQILCMLSASASNQDIADRLFVSLHTVKSHLYKIFRKIDAHNRLEAVNWFRHNFGMPPPLELINKRHQPINKNLPT